MTRRKVVVYQNKVVAVVKVGGKVLRERDGEVFLPFGSEYSILIKNLHPVRIKVKVSADGQDITENVWLVVGPNSSLELERFIRNDGLDKGNRLKFIERTGAIEEYRGILPDDGLVRVEYQVEEREVRIPVKYDYEYCPIWPRPWPTRRRRWNDQHWDTGWGLQRSFYTANNTSVQYRSANIMSVTTQQNETRGNDNGITVPGSESRQQFHHALNFETSETGVIVLRLRGLYGQGEFVEQTLTVEQKPKCSFCGNANAANNRFCSNCGASLVLY